MTDANDRFASIAGGGLKRRRPTISAVPDPVDTAGEPKPAVESGQKQTPARREDRNEPTRKASSAERSRPKSAETGGTRRASFRIPEDVDAKLRDRVRADGTSKVHVMLDAIEHVVATDTKLDFSTHTPSPTKSALFTRPRTHTGATPTVQAEVTMDFASLATIDKLVDKYNAPTRTAFVLACLGEYLN